METAESGGRAIPPHIPLPEWGNYFAWPPIGGLRHLRFYCATNGYQKAFIKPSGRVLIVTDEFLRISSELGHMK